MPWPGCDGILLYHYHGTTNYARNIAIFNNTTYNNNQSPTTPYYGGIATDHETAQNVVVRNNLYYENLGFAIKQPWNLATVMDHNLTSNPAFLNSARADFHLHSSSPAINYGSPSGAPAFDFDGSARPNGAGFDAGAFEYYPAAPVKLQLLQLPGQPSLRLQLLGGPESHYRVEWQPTLEGVWNLLQDIPSLPCSPYALNDPTLVSTTPQRFYRAVLVY